jgi:uncharacterized membrane protein YgdD (TMEM256/DUF423 family)
MYKKFLIIAALLAAIAVAFGAFGAHGLKLIANAEVVNTFDTGVRYQFYHVFALFLTGILYRHYPFKVMIYAGNCFILGILLFSGSLYLLTALKVTNTVGLSGVGLITPIGGLFFIVGWLLIAVGIMKKQK